MTDAVLPRRLTVAELQRVLDAAPSDAVVVLELPPRTVFDASRTTSLDIRAHFTADKRVHISPVQKVVQATPRELPAEPNRIHAAGNVLIPAILALESRGFAVTRHGAEHDEYWLALRGDSEAIASDPIQLLGLVSVVEERGRDWAASDAEIEAALRRFELDPQS